MNDSNLPFLEDQLPNEEAVQAEPAAAAPPEPEKGAENATPPVAQEEVKGVPITALLDEREKRQRAERELEQLRQWRLQQEEAARRAQQPKPDFFADPERAIAEAQRVAVAASINTKLETSRFLAEKEFGADMVKEAYAFFDQNPQLSQPLLNHPSPFHEAVRVYKRHKLLSAMGDDPEAYIEAQIKARIPSAVQAPPAPPPSMAAAPSAGAGKAPPSSGFDALFVRE